MQKNIEYNDILKEIYKQLNKHKYAVIGRTMLVSWPGLIVVMLLSIFFNIEGTVLEGASGIILWLVVILFPFALLYMLIMAHIFFVEKNLWIDSFFDQKNLSLKESQRIARKLIWPTLLLKANIFFRYYFLQIIVLFTISFLIVLFFGSFERWWIAVVLLFFVFPISAYFWHIFIKTKLRYLWFVFFDNYGNSDFSYKFLYSEIRKLNEINRSDSFQKSLVACLGSDVANNLITFSTNGMIKSSFSKFGVVGDVAGDTSASYAAEVFAQFASLSKIVANYLLYQVAFRELYKKEKRINENIYSLAN